MEFLITIGIIVAIIVWDKKIRKRPPPKYGSHKTPSLIEAYDQGQRSEATSTPHEDKGSAREP